jgi:hypothetical protein
MSQSDWPEEGRGPDHAHRSGQRPPDDWSDQPSGPPSGMSGGMKACLIIVCILGFCCILCCGVVGYLGYNMRPQISEAPADINAARDEIATMNIPAGLVPKNSVKMDNMFISMIMVEYENPGHASLFMMQMRPKMGGNDATGPWKQQFEQNRVTHSNIGEMKNAKMETKQIKIKGHEYTFTFTKGEGEGPVFGNRRFGRPVRGKGADGKAKEGKAKEGKVNEGKAGKGEDAEPEGAEKKPAKMTQREEISGQFEGKNGFAVINIDFDDTYKEADFIKMLESIQ